MARFRVVTEKGSYRATTVIEADDSQAAWDAALQMSSQSSERVVSVDPVRFGIYCVRGADSQLGYAEAWMKGKDEQPKLFDTQKDAEAEVERICKGVRSVNLIYLVQEYLG